MYSIVMYVHIAIVEIHSYVYIDQSKRKVHYNNNIIHNSLTESLPIAIYHIFTYMAIKDLIKHICFLYLIIDLANFNILTITLYFLLC